MKKTLLLFSLCLFTFWGMAQNFSMDFDGTDDRVSAGILNLSGTQLTIETWVKADQFQAAFPFISTIGGIEEPVGGSTNAAMLRFGDETIPNSQPQFFLQFGAGTQKLNSGVQVPLNTWTHIAATYDGSQMRIYVNGVLSNSIARTGSFTANGTFMLASSYTGRFLNGRLDEFRIWTVARTAAEIMSGMNTELTGNEAGLVAYFKFDDDNAFCDVADCSPNENHADRSGPLGTNNLPQFNLDVPAITDVACGVTLQDCSAPPPPPPGGGGCDDDVWAPLIVYPSQD
ncbi:MAG: LamG domain-containing protein, partial [Phaeodactylibacter sp.]|nr:LamG domain-containing protein [Phaeodactylibacter sp.]